MSCFYPIYRIVEGSGNWYRLPESDRHRVRYGGVFYWDYNAVKTLVDDYNLNFDDIQVLRCGQCMDCRLAYSRDWAVRCSLEAELHEFNYFVTLTYDELSVPRVECFDYFFEVHETTLVKSDIQTFVKNLREKVRHKYGLTGIKVFYCGEYGDLTSRPHYHLILFGMPELTDLVFSFKRGSYKFYKSSFLESCWCDKDKFLKGFVDVSEASFDTMAYTARYCTKKLGGLYAKDFYKHYDTLDPALRLPVRQQPFVGMSLKPGIAADYYNKHKFLIQQEDLVRYHKNYDLFKAKPPRYFDKLFDREDPEGFEKLRQVRSELGVASRHNKLSSISEPEGSRFGTDDKILNDKLRRYNVRDF